MSNWRDLAACRQAANPEIFYSQYAEDIENARSFCKSCPVVAQCLNAANDFENHTAFAYGIWGARTPIDRKPSMRRELKAYGRPRKPKMNARAVTSEKLPEVMLTLHDILRLVAPGGIECSYGNMQQKLLAYLPQPMKIPGTRGYQWAETPELTHVMEKLSRSYQERLAWKRMGAVTRQQARQTLSQLTGTNVDNRQIRDRWLKRVKKSNLKPCCKQTVWGAPLYYLAEDQESWKHVYREVPGISSQLLDQVTEIARQGFINQTQNAKT